MPKRSPEIEARTGEIIAAYRELGMRVDKPSCRTSWEHIAASVALCEESDRRMRKLTARRKHLHLVQAVRV